MTGGAAPKPRRRKSSPAQAPEAQPDQPPRRLPPGFKEYEVIGPHKVFGADPGSRFVKRLPPWQEAALIEGGHLKPTDKE